MYSGIIIAILSSMDEVISHTHLRFKLIYLRIMFFKIKTSQLFTALKKRLNIQRVRVIDPKDF